MGAPVTVYNRIDDKNIRVHSNIYQPDYSVVVDESLLEVVNVTAGLKKTGAVIVNTEKSKEEILPHLHGYEGELYTIDARKISMETLGKYFPNTPMLAAVVKVTKAVEEDTFLKEMEDSFKKKFATKPEVIEGNLKALKAALKEVQ